MYHCISSLKGIWAIKFHIAQLRALDDSASCSLKEENNPRKN